MVTADPATRDPDRLTEAAAEAGLVIGALHAPFLLVTRRVWGTDPVGKIERAVEVASAASIPLVVIHPPYRWQVRARAWIREHLRERTQGSGVTVAVENMFPIRLPFDRGARFHGDEGLGDPDHFPDLVLDTSHAAVAGLDIRTVWESERRRIRHVHLSNNSGKGWDSHLPVDREGVLPIDEFLGDLVRDRYTGAVTLEFDLRPWLRDERALREVLERNRALVEEWLAPRGRTRRRRTAVRSSRGGPESPGTPAGSPTL